MSPGVPSPSDLKATSTNRMHSNDLEACGKTCCYFLFPFRSQILGRVFDIFLDLVILVSFNAISIDFYSAKSFIGLSHFGVL